MNITFTNPPSLTLTSSNKSIPVVPPNSLSEKPANWREGEGIKVTFNGFDIDFNLDDWLNEEPQTDFTDKKQGDIREVFSKLTEEQQRILLESGMAVDDEFLSLSKKLEDEELFQLTDVIVSTKVAAQALFNTTNEYEKHGFRAGKDKLNQFMEVLNDSDKETRTQILTQAHIYSANVNIYEDDRGVNDTYHPKDGTFKATSSSNNIQNFMSSIIDTDSPKDFIDKLSQFDSDQQSDLLNVLGFDQDIGERLLDSMLSQSEEVKDSMLDFMGDTAIKSNAYTFVKSFASTSSNVFGIKYGLGDNLKDTVKDMLNDTVSLLENFDFSEEQMLDMSSDLLSMNRKDQIAYLKISSIGLDSLLGEEMKKTPDEPLDMSQQENVMHSLELLRSDLDIREAVYKTREGEEWEGDSRFFKAITESQYQESATELVSFLINRTPSSDKLNADEPSFAASLLERFNSLHTKTAE